MAWRDAALAAYQCCQPELKARLCSDIADPRSTDGAVVSLPAAPGRPVQPELIHPGKVPRRGLGQLPGRIALIHAVAHIEFNAINLALDAALRFAGMPLAFYQDWISVARDEARHFQMLNQRLRELDANYGDCPAHNGLWEMAEKTAHDSLLRMALVPRVLEARGLDVTPGMMTRLRSVGDNATVACLEIILKEEVRHVAIGSRWFRYLCQQRGLNSDDTFIELLSQYLPNRKAAAGQLNEMARIEAGFSAAELDSIRG
ncbi:MAG: ferritin-like domain-containing protein [Oceanococcus sp.]